MWFEARAGLGLREPGADPGGARAARDLGGGCQSRPACSEDRRLNAAVPRAAVKDAPGLQELALTARQDCTRRRFRWLETGRDLRRSRPPSILPRRATAQRSARGDAATEAAGASGVLLRPALVGCLRDRADHPRARPRRARAARAARRGWRWALSLLLAIVVASYRQTCAAYPNGGGAYAVSRANLGENASLTAASALLIDYVLTVAVSVVAGVAAITSAVPDLAPLRGGALARLCRGAVARQPARGQGVGPRLRAARPTDSSLCVFAMLAVGLARIVFGDGITAESAGYELRHVDRDGRDGCSYSCVFRAFASGCTALTGVEAVSNGVPAFEKPKSRNAATTLVIMGVLVDHDVRRDHGARDRLARAHGRGYRESDRLPGRGRAEDGDQPDRARRLRRRRCRSTCCRRSRRRS